MQTKALEPSDSRPHGCLDTNDGWREVMDGKGWGLGGGGVGQAKDRGTSRRSQMI